MKNVEAISNLFNVDRSGVVRHINNIYNDEELDEGSTCAKIAQVQKEGNRNVKRTYKQAVEKAETEYEKFRIKQDREYISSMDKMYKKYLEGEESK